MKQSHKNRSIGITIVAALIVLFGLAEVATGFTHSFLGILSTTRVALATYGAACVGAIYALGGLFLLIMRRWAARLVIVRLALVIIGRVALVLTGLYPLTSFLQIFSIITGTGIAVIFAVYIVLHWSSFQ